MNLTTAPGTLSNETTVGKLAVQRRNVYEGKSRRVAVVVAHTDSLDWALVGMFSPKRAEKVTLDLLCGLVTGK